MPRQWHEPKRWQLSQIVSLQETIERLAEQLKGAVASSRTNQNELLRLRVQRVRFRQLEQENAELKTQRQQLTRQPSQAAGASAEQRPTAISEVAKATGDSPPPRDTTDLGSLELESGVAVHFDLGGGTSCSVSTGWAPPQGSNKSLRPSSPRVWAGPATGWLPCHL